MTVLAFNWAIPLYLIFILLGFFLIFVVLIQPPKGEGLASAFSGAGSESFFGARAHQQISWFTGGIALALVVLALIITKITRPPREPGGGGDHPAPATQDGGTPSPDAPPATPEAPAPQHE